MLVVHNHSPPRAPWREGRHFPPILCLAPSAGIKKVLRLCSCHSFHVPGRGGGRGRGADSGKVSPGVIISNFKTVHNKTLLFSNCISTRGIAGTVDGSSNMLQLAQFLLVIQRPPNNVVFEPPPRLQVTVSEKILSRAHQKVSRAHQKVSRAHQKVSCVHQKVSLAHQKVSRVHQIFFFRSLLGAP